MADVEVKSPRTEATLGTGLEAVLADYLHALEAGSMPDEQAILSQHPELAVELGSFFRNRREMELFARPLRPPGGSPPAGSPRGLLQYLGDYELLEEIGFGGMGVIFKARQTSLQRTVAIKMILDGRIVSSEERQRFHMEAEAAASLEHPHILPIYEVGEHDGRQYFSMKHVEGGSLSQRLAGGPLAVREAASLLIAVARAVHFAHQRGILHRDLKPANILLDADGQPFVSDFGLAKLLASHSDLTHTGAVLGTPSYMAPEQAAGQSRRVTIATDVYGLGAILYAALVGRAPFQAKNVVETLRLVLDSNPQRPSALRREIDSDLETICLKSLQKEPSHRYASAEEFARDLERYLAGEPVSARPIHAAAKSWRWCRRNPVVASLAALLLVALVAVATTSSLAYFNELAHGHVIKGKNIEITQALAREELFHAEATQRLYRSLVAQARANRLSRRIGQRFDSLELLVKASRMAREVSLTEDELVELRTEAIACMTLTDVRMAQQWNGWPTGSLHVDFDSTLERYARVDRAGNISVRRVSDDVELYSLVGLGPGESWPTLSPNGKYLAVWNNRFKLWSLADPVPVLVGEGPGIPEFRYDSRQFATLFPQNCVTLFELPSGKQFKEIHSESPIRVAFHPLLPQLAVSSRTGIRVLDVESEAVLAHTTQHLPQNGAWNLNWHPDGKTIAFVGSDFNIYAWNIAADKVIAELKGHSEGTTLAYGPTGNILASAGWGQPLRLWNPQTAEQMFQVPLLMTEFLRFSPDERRLAVAIEGDGRLGILELAVANDVYRTLIRDPAMGVGDYCASAISPDGRLVAAAMADGIAIWHLFSGQPVTFLPTGSMMRAVRFEPTGALLATGPAGLARWAVEFDPANPMVVQIGPQQNLPLEGRAEGMAMSQDGRIVAQAVGWGAVIWHRDSSAAPLRVMHNDTRYIDVSPNGLWVATGSHFETKVKIWDADSGMLAHELPVEGGSRVFFSPDSLQLVTSHDGNRLWSVDSGEQVCYLGGFGAVAFSPDNKLLAMETGNGRIRLMNRATGRDYAVLEDPHQDRASQASFSNDGMQLTVTSNERHAIHIWNLRAIRGKLAEMGFDQDLPKDPEAKLPATLTLASSVIADAKSNSLRIASSESPKEFAYWSPEESAELSLVDQIDGHFNAVQTADQGSVVSTNAGFCFHVGDAFACDVTSGCQDQFWLEVSLRDQQLTTIDVQYDAHQGQVLHDGQWSESPQQQTAGDGEWKSLVFELRRPRLANSHQHGIDLRIRSSQPRQLEIRSVRLWRGLSVAAQ